MPVTADLYIPFDSGDGSNVAEAGWRAMARHWLSDGPLITADAPGGGLEPSAGAGRQVLVAAGAVWIQGHFAEWESQSALDIATNTSGSTRVDAIVVVLDTVGNEITLDVVEGTPGAGLPSLTQTSSTWQLLIGAATIANGGTSVTVADWRVLSGPEVAGRQIGEVFMYPSGTVPGWALEVNGQNVSRNEYAALFNRWSTTFGVGNGSTTFTLMNMQGRVPVGQNTGDSSFDVIGETGGSKTPALLAHSHSIAADGPTTHYQDGDPTNRFVVTPGTVQNHRIPESGSTSNGAYISFSDVDPHPTHSHGGATGSASSGSQTAGNMPPYITTRWIVRAR